MMKRLQPHGNRPRETQCQGLPPALPLHQTFVSHDSVRFSSIPIFLHQLSRQVLVFKANLHLSLTALKKNQLQWNHGLDFMQMEKHSTLSNLFISEDVQDQQLSQLFERFSVTLDSPVNVSSVRRFLNL